VLIDLIRTDDPRWLDVLGRLPHDIYHLPDFVDFSASGDGGTPTAFYAEHGGHAMLVPLILRPLPGELGAPADWSDAVSPYGYPAPLVSEAADPETVQDFFRGLLRLSRERKIASIFLRSHPLLPFFPLECEAAEVVQHGRTIHVDLTVGVEVIDSQVRKGYRYDIRKLEREGFTTTIDEWGEYPDFVEIYRKTMERLSADDEYMLSHDYFQGLREALADRLHLCSVRSPDGALAASALFSECGGIVQYLFSGTAEAFLRMAPSKLVLYSMIRWAHDRDARVCHLGGGAGAREDSLYTFKAGFSKLSSGFSTLRLIPDRARYRTLVERMTEVHHGERSRGPGYFPAYRAN
jgi:hypothetical protein